MLKDVMLSKDEKGNVVAKICNFKYVIFYKTIIGKKVNKTDKTVFPRYKRYNCYRK